MTIYINMIVGMLLITFNINGHSAEVGIDQDVEYIKEAGMTIWTWLDLMRAINITELDKEYFLQELNRLFKSLDQAKLDYAKLDHEQSLYLIDLLNALIKALQEIFPDNQSNELQEHYLILRTTLGSIKSTKQYQQ